MLLNAIHSSHEMASGQPLHVIGVISNHAQWHSRYRLFRAWLHEMKATPNVVVHVVELSHGDHCHELEAECAGGSYLKLRSPSGHLWLKEAMINAAVRYLLPRDWKYAATVDCDVRWPDKRWAKRTIQALQNYQVVQPWATCNDLGPHGQTLQHHESFAYILSQGVPMKSTWDANYKYAHTGYAWAFTRKFWEQVGGFMDFNLVGSSDHHQAWGLINRVHDSVHGKMTDGFKRACEAWAKKAYRATNGNIGVVLTRIEHEWHGAKRNRYYRERWQIFVDHKFDPFTDLAYDEMGLPYILGKPALDEEIRRYNFSRHEDATSEG